MNARVRALVSYGTDLSMEYRRTRSALAAGGLAYFVALSLAPAALAFGTLAGLLLDPADLRSALDRLAERTPDTFEAIEPVTSALMSTIESASTSSITLTTIVSALVAIYAASKVVLGLRMAMNAAFHVHETRSGLMERAFATLVTLVALVSGIALVVLLTIVPRVLSFLQITQVPVSTGTPVLDWLVVVLVVFVAVRWLLQHGPNRRARVPWRSMGAWVSTVGVVGATIGVGVYVHFSASIGAAVLVFGTAVVILLWLYLCFIAILWGAIIEAHAERGRAPLGADATTDSGGEPARGTGHDAGQESGDSSGETHVEGIGPRGEDAEDEGAHAGDASRDHREPHATSG